ncbi:hypothetical protein FPRO06_03074 [Fusarium proliferatum]|nr:hypothetical protein FPRO06_03074 [Fusarium proliferatum]
MQQDTSPGPDEAKTSETENLGLEDDDLTDVDYEALEQYNLDVPDDMPLEDEDNLGPVTDDDEELFSERHRSYILEQNAEFWENHKDQPINLQGRGRICCGPGLCTGAFVLEPCPGRVVIDLDTSRLRLGDTKNGIRPITLNYACVSCFTLKRARAFLEQGKAKSDGSLENVDLTALRNLFADAAETEWTCPPEFQKVLERVKDIEEGKMPPCSLLILDTEFSVATRQPWEVTIIEYLSAKTRLNALLDHADGLSHESQERRIVQISKMHAKNVYNPKRNLDRLNVHQVAKTCKEIGIDSDTLFVIWATYPLDLQLLRNYLEAGGCKGILPNDKQCIPVCQTFRQNLPRIKLGKQFPVRLEIIFPVFYPEHKLIGANHQALADCQQAREMCLAIPELRKAVKNRKPQWRPENIRKLSTNSILNYFPAAKEEQKSDGVPKKSKQKNKSAGKPLKPPMSQSKLSFVSQAQSESQEAARPDVMKPVRHSKRLQFTRK